jgi:hypothetical protein
MLIFNRFELSAQLRVLTKMRFEYVIDPGYPIPTERLEPLRDIRAQGARRSLRVRNEQVVDPRLITRTFALDCLQGRFVDSDRDRNLGSARRDTATARARSSSVIVGNSASASAMASISASVHVRRRFSSEARPVIAQSVVLVELPSFSTPSGTHPDQPA